MPRVLSLKKIKGKKEHAHPHSRKANQIQRAALRDERLRDAGLRRDKDRYALINRVGFFKVAVMSATAPVPASTTPPAATASAVTNEELRQDEQDGQDGQAASTMQSDAAEVTTINSGIVRAFSVAETRSLISAYIGRRDADLEAERKLRRPGRPKSAKEDQLAMAIQAEHDEYRTGFKVPDLTDPHNVLALIQWPGDWGGLNNVKLVEVKRED